MNEETFHAALRDEPGDELTWQALADFFDDDGQSQRADLLRLTRRMLPTSVAERGEMARRYDELIAGGVKPVVVECSNSIGMRFALISPGAFLMGATKAEDDEAFDGEGPRHEARITKAFWMGVHPVTQRQWKAVMGSNPSYFCATGGGAAKVQGMDTDDFPVEQVSWEDVTVFLMKLAALTEESRNRRGYRLPTEAEWEYSCRNSGPYQKYHFGDSLSHEQANFGNRLGRTSKVGTYPANARGLYDMHGNVFEWCADSFGDYPEGPVTDPSGPPDGPYRVRRGGSWFGSARFCRCAFRDGIGPGVRDQDLGFRAALVPAP